MINGIDFMKGLFSKTVTALLMLLIILPALAQNDTRVTYIHTDADGTPFAATDEQGNLEWQIEHLPFGGEHSNTEVRRNSNLSFAGKMYDEEIGLSYFGGRWYDPASGRFTGIDPMPVSAEDWKTFNRYVYGNNNPYKYVDPDGNLPILIPLVIFLAKEGVAEVAGRYTGGATDLLSVRRMSSKLVQKSLQLLRKNKSGTAGTGGDLVRVRHVTDKVGRNGIKKDGAINPGRPAGLDDTVGVHVEVAPFGKLKTAGEELGVAYPSKSKNFVEFDIPKSALKKTNIGSPRNTGVIATKKPLNISDKNPKFK